MRRILCLVALSFVGCRSQGVELRRDGDLVQVTLDGLPFATVHAAAAPRPFVYPVFGPGSVPMTRGFPLDPRADEEHDHPHHQSLWFAHGNVDGFDFWQGVAHHERIVLDGLPEIEGGRVRCRYSWLADDDTLVASEVRDLVFGGSDDARTIDIDVTMRPGAAPLVFGDTKEGTFAMRVHPALRVDGKVAKGTLRNSEGVQGKDVWGKRARWIDDRGVVDGHDVGITMFDRPGNPSFPTWWHARTYGLLAANPFGVHDFEGKPAGAGALTVPVGGELHFHYRVLLHSGGWDAARVDAAYGRWISE